MFMLGIGPNLHSTVLIQLSIILSWRQPLSERIAELQVFFSFYYTDVMKKFHRDGNKDMETIILPCKCRILKFARSDGALV
jgi:hypothetical protein